VWFGKIDTTQAGKVGQEDFNTRFGDVLAPPAEEGQGSPANTDRPDDRQRQGGRRGGFARFLAPGFLTATDTNKDGSLTREEWTGTFAKWFTDWDTDKSECSRRSETPRGFNAALPRPQFGGGGGPGGGRGGFGGGGRGGLAGPAEAHPGALRSSSNADGREELVIALPGCIAAF
jgi:hypothetical protein